jgi:hypothetical protein
MDRRMKDHGSLTLIRCPNFIVAGYELGVLLTRRKM